MVCSYCNAWGIADILLNWLKDAVTWSGAVDDGRQIMSDWLTVDVRGGSAAYGKCGTRGPLFKFDIRSKDVHFGS